MKALSLSLLMKRCLNFFIILIFFASGIAVSAKDTKAIFRNAKCLLIRNLENDLYLNIPPIKDKQPVEPTLSEKPGSVWVVRRAGAVAYVQHASTRQFLGVDPEKGTVVCLPKKSSNSTWMVINKGAGGKYLYKTRVKGNYNNFFLCSNNNSLVLTEDRKAKGTLWENEIFGDALYLINGSKSGVKTLNVILFHGGNPIWEIPDIEIPRDKEKRISSVCVPMPPGFHYEQIKLEITDSYNKAGLTEAYLYDGIENVALNCLIECSENFKEDASNIQNIVDGTMARWESKHAKGWIQLDLLTLKTEEKEEDNNKQNEITVESLKDIPLYNQQKL